MVFDHKCHHSLEGDAQMTGGISRHVLKVMGLFGGVRMLQIVFGVVRTKLIAVWLGPAGVGLFGIFNGATETVRTLTQLGMRSSAVRDIAGSSPDNVGGIVSVVRRWGLMLGVLGVVVMALLSPLLSRFTFDSSGMTPAYLGLGAALFFLSVAGAEEAVLQGTGRLRNLAKASVWGAAAGLVFSVPMYYFWGLDSVVPSIVVYSAVTCGALLVFRARGLKGSVSIGLPQTFEAGKRFIVLGIYMTAADFLAQAMSYVFIAWLNNRGGDAEVGFYQAGYTMVNRYVGLIFMSLATEYYPRLARVATSRLRLSVFVAHETALILLLLLPAITLFMSMAPWLVRLLYDRSFEPAVPFIVLAMTGIVLRGVSYCMSYVILAKGDGRTFLLTESVSAVAGLALNIVCYLRWGLAGLGVSYTLWYLLYVVIVGRVYFSRYRLGLPRGVIWFACIAVAVTIVSVVLALLAGSLCVLPVALTVGCLSLIRLRKMVGRKNAL